MKKKAFVIFILVAAVAVAGTLLFLANKNREEKEKVLTEKLTELKEIAVPMRFRLLERTGGVIKAELCFYSIVMGMDEFEADKDLETRFSSIEPIAKRMVELPGQELFLDFLTYKEKEKRFAHPVYWVFPYRVFTDGIAPDDGTPIADAYNANGFPSIYENFELTDDQKSNLASYYEVIQNYATLNESSPHYASIKKVEGQALHDINTVARFKVDRWYSVIVHIKQGTAEFVLE